MLLSTVNIYTVFGKSSESVQCAMLKACDACADMGQLQRTVPIRKTFPAVCTGISMPLTTLRGWPMRKFC